PGGSTMPHYPKPFFKKSHGAWYVQLDGQQFRLHEQEAEARRIYHELMAERGKPSVKPTRVDDSPLLVQVIDKFLDFCQDHRAESTYGSYRDGLQLFVTEVAGRMAIDELRPFHLDDWLAKHPDWASGTKHNGARMVMRALSWAEKRGRIESN